MAPSAPSFRAQVRVTASGVWKDVGHEYTCFMRWGEDARLHGRFHRFCERMTGGCAKILPVNFQVASMRQPAGGTLVAPTVD